MNEINQPESLLFSLSHKGKNYLRFTEEDLLKEGVPQVEIDKVKIEQIKELRHAAYLSESDPLNMEWQYDQTAESEKAWRDKVAEIKLRYPLQTEL